MVVDLSIVIGIHATEELVYLLLTQSEIVILQTHSEFILAYGSAVVLVEVAEGGTQVILLQVVIALEASCDELTVINQTILVCIDHGHRLRNVLL